MINLHIHYKKKIIDIQVPKEGTILDLKKEFYKKTNLSIHRQSFKLLNDNDRFKPIPLDNDLKSINDYKLNEKSTILFKDFGPQIGYRTVFITEYFGPIIIMLFYSLRPSIIYNHSKPTKLYTKTSQIAIILFILHFIKREYETIFIHRFSRPTMPLFNLFKNSIYYWTFTLFIGHPICHPLFTPPSSSIQILFGLLLFLISEVMNFFVHLQLRNLRPSDGSKQRPIPKGILFSYVSCPNYTFEVLGWLGFSIMTNTLLAFIFTFVGFIQMADWASKKHYNYIKKYGDDYKKLKRKAIIPFIF